RERCTIGPGRMVSVDSLYDAWRQWCEANGRDHPGTKQTFGRDLAAAVPHLRVSQRRIGGRVVRVYEGIGLRDDAEAPRCASGTPGCTHPDAWRLPGEDRWRCGRCEYRALQAVPFDVEVEWKSELE